MMGIRYSWDVDDRMSYVSLLGGGCDTDLMVTNPKKAYRDSVAADRKLGKDDHMHPAREKCIDAIALLFRGERMAGAEKSSEDIRTLFANALRMISVMSRQSDFSAGRDYSNDGKVRRMMYENERLKKEVSRLKTDRAKVTFSELIDVLEANRGRLPDQVLDVLDRIGRQR